MNAPAMQAKGIGCLNMSPWPCPLAEPVSNTQAKAKRRLQAFMGHPVRSTWDGLALKHDRRFHIGPVHRRDRDRRAPVPQPSVGGGGEDAVAAGVDVRHL